MEWNQISGAPAPPAGRMLDVGGVQMHIHCSGEGGPPVVMEAAIWDVGLTWALVQPEVAQFTRACVYDRAGLGWSQAGPRPRSAEVMVEELRALLDRAAVAPPYVLVGQSFAGLVVRLYAYRHPQEVAGLVLVDAAHEDQDQRFPEPIREMLRPMAHSQVQHLRQLQELATAQGPEAAPPLLAMPSRFPAEAAAHYRALLANRPARLETMIAELEAMELSRAQVRAARHVGLGDRPLAVLSHGIAQSVPTMPDDVNQAYEEAWQTMQVELAAQSSRGERAVAGQSGHMVHH